MAFYDMRPGQDRAPAMSLNTDFVDPSAAAFPMTAPTATVSFQPGVAMMPINALVVQGDTAVVARAVLLAEGIEATNVGVANVTEGLCALQLFAVSGTSDSKATDKIMLMECRPDGKTGLAQAVVNAAFRDCKIRAACGLATATSITEPCLYRGHIDEPESSDGAITLAPPDVTVSGPVAAALVAPLSSLDAPLPKHPTSTAAAGESNSSTTTAPAAGGGSDNGIVPRTFKESPGVPTRGCFIISRPDRAAADAAEHILTGLRLSLERLGAGGLFPASQKALTKAKLAAQRALRRRSGATYGLLYL